MKYERLGIDGHNIEAYIVGEKAVNNFEEELEAGRRFDVVVTDLGMPDVDGRR